MRYQRMLLSLALKMLADEEDAKDVVQEAFIKAWVNMLAYSNSKGKHVSYWKRTFNHSYMSSIFFRISFFCLVMPPPPYCFIAQATA